ncbi:MAG: hypothetical protein ABL897_07925 [Hyphomicrobium sp.]
MASASHAGAENHANGNNSFIAPQSINIPQSVHELDTTPRDEPRPMRTSSGSHTRSPHETVNQPPDEPKAGWWRRLTGQ